MLRLDKNQARNKQYDKLATVINERIYIYLTAMIIKVSSSSIHELEILQKVNMDLANELHVSKSTLSDH